MMHSLTQIRKALDRGELSLVQMVSNYLSNIKKTNELNIYIETYDDEALQRAKELDAKRLEKPDSLGKLHGMVMSIKDVLCYEGHQVSAGSKMLTGFTSQFTATAVQRALDEDAIIIGRTNCDEFAMGSSNEHSHYGPTLNGDDPTRVPGGSSGAAAVSVQVDTCLVALGSDTGGSVRQPAAFCGVTGMKPSYGRISRYGLIAYASSFDQIGILSKDIDTIRTTLSCIEGDDPMDSTSQTFVSTAEDKKYSRFVYFPEVVDHPKLNPELRDMILSKIDQLRDEGHTVETVHFPYLEYLVPCYYVLTTAEASSNLSRYDGIRYGHRSKNASTISELYINSRSEGFGMEVKRRIMMGTFVLSVGYFDAYFVQAQRVRQLINKTITSIFRHYDYILLPTSTDIAWKLGAVKDDPLEMYLSDVFTVLANLCGLPAISIPLTTDANHNHKMSFGLQLMASKGEDFNLLSAARHF